jgi:hypothetical protein
MHASSAVLVVVLMVLMGLDAMEVAAFHQSLVVSQAAALRCQHSARTTTTTTTQTAMAPIRKHWYAQGPDDDDDGTFILRNVHTKPETGCCSAIVVPASIVVEETSTSRRQFTRFWWGLWGAASVAVTVTTTPASGATIDSLVSSGTSTQLSTSTVFLGAATATTDSSLFRGQPLLTNPLLEQVRIWNQAQADNIRYGGELERGDTANRGQVSAYPQLLVPILRMARDVDRLVASLESSSSSSSSSVPASVKVSSRPRLDDAEMVALLSQPVYDTIEFKRIFNAFADNIYYSDPDRANLYLAGGGTFV